MIWPSLSGPRLPREIDDAALPLVMNRAVPPVGLKKKFVLPLLLVVIFALPAVAKALKLVRPKSLLVISALPAVAVSLPNGVPIRRKPPLLLVILADCAED